MSLIRRARPGDEAAIVAMIGELAEFERAADECTVTEKQIRQRFSAPTRWFLSHRRGGRRAGRHRGVVPQLPPGTAWPASTSRTCSCPAFRRRGLARALLATLARECVDNGYSRLSWAVLDWNVNAIGLYDAVGGRQMSEWITHRASGPELSALAAES